MQSEIQKNKISVKESLSIGAAAGLAETIFNHPLWVLKTRSQCQYTFNLSPRVLYKGVGYRALTEMCLSSIQIGSGIKVSDSYNPTLGSLVSGALTGVAINPIEAVMVQQQKSANKIYYHRNSNFLKIARELKINCGYKVFFRGLPASVVKCGIFNYGIFVLAPFFSKTTKDYVANNAIAYTVGGVIAGIVSTIVTQPVDTVRSLQLDGLLQPKPLSFMQHSFNLYSAGKLGSFFKGLGWRCTQITTATTVINHVMEICRPSPPQLQG